MAGGLLSGISCSDVLEFAVRASAMKHTVSGDYNLVIVDEVETLIAGDASSRVKR